MASRFSNFSNQALYFRLSWKKNRINLTLRPLRSCCKLHLLFFVCASSKLHQLCVIIIAGDSFQLNVGYETAIYLPAVIWTLCESET